MESDRTPSGGPDGSPSSDRRRSSRRREYQSARRRCRSRSDHSSRRVYTAERGCSPSKRRSRRSVERRSERSGERRSRTRSLPRNRRNSRIGSEGRDVARRRKRRRVRNTPDSDSEDRKSKRSRYSATSDQNNSNRLLESFLDVLKSMKAGTNEKFSSLHNVIPEFDPMLKEQTITAWLAKVEECKQIYNWSEKQVIHYALPKLVGVAKTWYQSLPSLLHSWCDWKTKLLESFPSSQNYGELLTEMLNKKLRFGEAPELYYYEKINLLNRCKIHGENAVDCIVFGIEDRSMRLGAQAAQFSEPEQLLKFFKSIKPGIQRDFDRSGRDKEKRLSNNHAKPAHRTSKPESSSIVCFNCNQAGHPSYKCSKPLLKCNRCNLIGHLANACPKAEGFHKPDKEKTVLNIASSVSSGIYTFPISINETAVQCHLDLGSECTLIRLSDALKLGITWTTKIKLPLLKGLGNIPYQPIGSTKVNIEVQGITETDVDVLVVDDHLINYPVLLGHTFSERPSIKIIKTIDRLEIIRNTSEKVHLICSINTCVKPSEIRPVQVKSESDFTGSVLVTGGMRGQNGGEFYLFPGEYQVNNGKGNLLIYNLNAKDMILKSEQLITRSKRVEDFKEVLDVKLTNEDDEFEPIIGENVTSEQKHAVIDLLLKYRECFSTCLKDLGFTTVIEMDIHLKDEEPVVYRPYRLSHSEREDVRRMVAEMLDCGIVKESSSPYASPIVIVKKKSGEKRLCVDYRALNSRTKRDHYPLPRVEDLLDQLAGNNIFISLDLASGYYQIPISQRSQEKTSFVTPDGQFEYTRMPFGLANAPAVFQRAMHKILARAKVGYVIVYMDDVLIPARSFEEALGRLEEILKLLKDGGLTLKLKKCKFMHHKLDFLGFEISGDGIKPGSLKTDAVSRFPTPLNPHDVRRFIGLASFFRRFVKDFAVIARPLTSLLKKDSHWKWGSEEDAAFKEIKGRLITRPILALYDKTLETQLHTDASKWGVAGILVQKDKELWRAVAYYSRQTSLDEQKLHSFELETLAVIASLNKFRVYLLGLRFKIITDCNSLRTTLTKRDLIPRIARWWVQLQEFDCEIEYRAGEKMAHVDALSRAPIGSEPENLHVIDILRITAEDWITTVQSCDDEIGHIKKILSDPETAKVVDTYANYKLKNGRVYRILSEDTIRWVVPRASRWQIVKANHDDVGHFGIEKTLDRIRALYWFAKMRSFVTKYVSACLECAHHKMPSNSRQGHLHPIEKVEIPFHTIHADHVGPFNKSKSKNTYILVLIDAFTKFVTLAAVKSTKSSETIKKLKNLIGCFGTPTRLITDRGSCFTSKKFKTFTQSLGIKHILNAVSTPRANGQVERSNRTILASLGAMTHGKDPRTWDQYLPDVQLGINTTIHDVTKKTPSELLFGRRVTNPSQGILNDVISDTGDGQIQGTLDEVRAEAGSLMQKQSEASSVRYNSNRKKARQYNEGDLVRIVRAITSGGGQSKKLEPKLQGPYRVIKILPNDRYIVEDTPLSRKGRRYEAVIAADKMHPLLSFGSISDSDDSPDTEVSQNIIVHNDTIHENFSVDDNS